MSKCKYTKEQLEEAVRNSLSIAQVCRLVGIRPVGGNYKTLKEKFELYNIDTSHFTGQGWNVGLKFKPNKPKEMSEILVENSTYLNSNNLRQRLIKEGYKEHKCEHCGLTEWQGEPIKLELHHINGDNTDNRLENLQLLCSNCHSKTDNFRSKNKISKASDVRLQKYEEAMKLKELGLLESKEETPKNTKPKQEKTKLICPVCGKEFIAKGSTSKYCSVECYREDNKGNRPPLPQLIKDFQELKSFTQVGNKYGVSDNAVKKWCKLYQIPDRIKELKEYINNFNNPDYIIPESKPREKKNINKEQVVTDYLSGLSTTEVSKLHDCDSGYVRDILYKNNITLRKTNFKYIIQYDLEGNIINTFKGSTEAANWVFENNSTHAKIESISKNIQRACRDEKVNSNKAYGYCWKYEN